MPHTPKLITETQLAKGEHVRLNITNENGLVIMDFARNISHLELSPEDAEIVASVLQKHAFAARMKNA